MARIWSIDIRLPLQLSLALGPLIYFYVLRLTRPGYEFRRNDLLHFIPVLPEQFILQNPSLPFLTLISIIGYLYYCHRLIERFYQRQKFNGGDRYRIALRWLHKLLGGFGLVWLLWIPYTAVDYFYYHRQLDVQGYYIFHLATAMMLVWIAATAYLRPEIVPAATASVLKPKLPAELKQKGAWLKNAVKTNLYYQDPDLSLSSLAEKLGLTTHELSRIFNTVLKKSFNDFINECRVAEVIRNMQDPAYSHLTLMGIAYDSGFNSPSTFHRAFKERTGKTPAEYKKELPSYNLTQHYRFAPIISNQETTPKWSHGKLNRNVMLKNYFLIAFRNLMKNKLQSFINITGLSAGMAVSILIGLWIYNELSFDKYHRNYENIAQVMQSAVLNNETISQADIPIPLGEKLRTAYGNNFKKVVMSTHAADHIMAAGESKIVKSGRYMQSEAPLLFTLKILQGSGDGLKDPRSIIISRSTALALFGKTNPVNKIINFDNDTTLKVTGVYEDLPKTSTLHDLSFIVPWELQPHLKDNMQNWGNNGWEIFVQMADYVDLNTASVRIKDAKFKYADNGDQRFKPVIFLHPMSKWHLYSEFKNGINTGGEILYVRMFAIIGIVVLLLACINFMNLSTARSEKRAKEVGIRKAIGSSKKQLIHQFYIESLLVVLIAFIFSLMLILILLPIVNQIANEKIDTLWTNLYFWSVCIGFTIIVGLMAGSYPAFYLSSFQPVKVLKGIVKTGRLALLPRKVLVVLQFSASVVLIIGTIVVYNQVQFARNRPVGYDSDGLINIKMLTTDIYQHFDAFRNDLIKTGVVAAAAESSTPVTESNNSQSNFDWPGKDKNSTQGFATVGISQEYGKTIGWQFMDGRDYRTGPGGADAMAFVVNESASKMMGFKEPVGSTLHWMGYEFHIIGVVKDMVMQSPFDAVEPTIFYMAPWRINFLNIKIKPGVNASVALSKIETVFKQYNPGQPFNYQFADATYSRKFDLQERVGKLAAFFAVLAIFISCLGIFGMASFMAEQRIKEIGVRKVLGASVFSLWKLLTKDFVTMIIVSFLIAAPIAYYFMHKWLQNYQYRTNLSWWIFAVAGIGALMITLITVSFQSIKTAVANPVRSLRSE